MKPDPSATRNVLLDLFRIPWVRSSLVLLMDGLLTCLSLWGALLLRFEGQIWQRYQLVLPIFFVTLVVSRIAANAMLRLQNWSFRYSGLTDASRLGMAGLLGSGLFVLFLYFLHPLAILSRVAGPPRSVVVMEFFLSTTLMGLMRFSPRLAGMYLANRSRARGGTLRTVIVGAGAAGESLLRDLLRSHEHNYKLIGFVDDDPAKRRVMLGGRPVLGNIDDLPRIVKSHGVEKVLIAIPKLPAKRIRDILTLCADLKLRIKILPLSFLYLKDRTAAAMLQDLSPEDLLPREMVSFVTEDGHSPAAGHRALVTGAAGSIGGEICLQLARSGIGQLVLVDINENGLYLLLRRLQREYPDLAVAAEVADIRDLARVRTLFARYRPQDVFHAAAHKHVPLLETAPAEAVKNNILGTRNVIAAADSLNTERFVLISTDKAVRPSSVMGASKRVAEMLVRDRARRSATRFCAVRFGNVLGSAGSVVPLFKEQIAAGGPVTVTHPEVKRFFMTISEAVGLVLKAAYGDYGSLCVLDMGEQIRIIDLARGMIAMSGLVPDVDIPVVFTGLRPGEKLSEELLTEAEESTAQVNRKIFVAEGPPPPANLAECVRSLEEAAAAEDGPKVIALLHELIPTYTPDLETPLVTVLQTHEILHG